MTLLDLQNLNLTLGETAVLDNIAIHVAKGEFVWILGPSGA
ncbi:hypothetical protein [Pseudooctadecabacter sp.]